MKLTRLIVFSLLSVGLCYFLNDSHRYGEIGIPALGKIFSPNQGIWQNAESIQQNTYINLSQEELNASVEVIYDDRLVPHIYASSDEDAFFTQGYLHAKHRLFQMDVSTRAAGGRLSEIFGVQTLEKDKIAREMGMVYAAENAIKGWKKHPEAFQLLEQYTKGVNAYICQLTYKNLPLEFKLFNYEPELWTPLKTALFQKQMALTLCGYHDDIESNNMLNYFGREDFDFLYPLRFVKESPIIPKEENLGTKNSSISANKQVISLIENDFFQTNPIPKPPKGVGSNNWAVSSSKTQHGNAILCNDPHLHLTLPSIWYEVHIHTPEQNTYGVSLPSIPGVIIGFNDFISWGATNVGHDLTDWYSIDWVDENQTKYRYDGIEKEVDYRIEKIQIRRQDPYIDTIKYTVWGPIIPEHSEWKNHRGLAMQWIAHLEPKSAEMNTFLEINKAENFEQFTKALSNYVAPAQNFIFADINGNIGLRVNGQLPIKSSEDGRFIKDGSKSKSGWKSYIPRDQIPHAYQPKRGYMSSANQHSADSTYPYYYDGKFEAYRGRMVNRLLQNMENITVDDMKKMHQNSYSLKAEEALPHMMAQLDKQQLNEHQKKIYEELSNWDYNYDSNSAKPCYFHVWFEKMYDNYFDEILTLDDQMSIREPHEATLVEILESGVKSDFADIKTTEKTENISDIIRMAFDQMTEQFDQENNEELAWSNFRKRDIDHISEIPSFGIQAVDAPGCGDAINAFDVGIGPSWRMIVEMDSEQVKGYGVYPGGQSGNPGSPYYKTGIENWRTGKYFDLHFYKTKEEMLPFKKKSLIINPTN